MAPKTNKPPRAPSAPSAPAVRNPVGNGQQNRGAMMGASKRAGASGGASPTGGASPGGGGNKPGNPNVGGGGVKPGDGPKGRFGGKRKTPLEKQQERERRRRERERNQNNNDTTTSVAPEAPPSPYPAEKPDPRDDQYWEHRTALENSFSIEDQRLIAEQTQADNTYALNTAQMDEYNRRRQRSIAMGRLGRGLRSGGFREERTLNDMDYMIDSENRRSAKAAEDVDRDLRRRGLASQLQADIQGLDREAAQRFAANLLDEAENSPGDAQDMEATFAREDLQKGIKQTTSRIKSLREKQADAGENEKAKLEKQIKKLQGRRTKMKGKLNG